MGCDTPIMPDAVPRFTNFDGGERLEAISKGELSAQPGNLGRFIHGGEIPYFADWLSASSVLSSMGDGGEELAQRLVSMGREFEAIQGRYNLDIEDAFRDLTPDEVATGVRRYLEDGATDVRAEVAQAAHKAQSAIRRLYNEARERGIDVADPIDDGTYFPHIFDDMASLWDEGSPRREAAIKELMGKEKITREMAAFRLGRWLDRNGERYAANVERPRLGIGGYVEDAKTAFSVSGFRVARRLAEFRHLGPHDQLAREAIGRMHPGAGQTYANRVLDLAVGRRRVPISKSTQDLLSINLAKLSFSPIINMTQSAHIMHKGGLVRTVKNIVRFLGEGVVDPGALLRGNTPMIRRARSVGATFQKTYHGIQRKTLDELVTRTMQPEVLEAQGRIVASGNKLKDFAVGAAELVAKPMAWTETFLRSVSAQVGDDIFDDAVRRLSLDPSDAATISRLKEFGIPADRIRRAINEGTGLQGLKDEFAKSMADITQFTTRPENLPLSAQTGLGRIMFQFKNFAFRQSGFIWDETVTALRKGERRRAARTFAALLSVYPMMGIAVDSVRSEILGGGWVESKESFSRLLDDPSFQNYFAAVIGGLTSVSTLGILGEALYAIGSQNLFASMRATTPVAGSTLIDAGRIFTSAARASYNADASELEEAQAAFSRQLGGFGRVLR